MIPPRLIVVALRVINAACAGASAAWRTLLAPWAFALLVLAHSAACGHPAKLVEPERKPTPFCFVLTADHEGRVEEALACTATRDLCSFAQTKAVFFAPIAHFIEIGACHYEAPR